MKRKSSWVLLGLGLMGCQSVYLDDGRYTQTKPPEPPTKEPAFVLDGPDVFNFREKEKGSFQLRASVPPPGKPIVTAQDLPAGAVFTPANLTLTWTPGKKDGDEPKPVAIQRAYVVKFLLQSSEDSVTTYERHVVLVVANNAKSLELDRAEWPESERMDLTVGEAFRVPMRLTDPAADAAMVGWNVVPHGFVGKAAWVDQELVIEPKLPGAGSIELVLKTDDGLENRQTFKFHAMGGFR